jgi:hypothetical protein
MERQIRFDAVRELGEYDCTVALSSDTQVPIKVWVVQDAAEAAASAADAAREVGEEASAEGDAEASPSDGAADATA